MNIIICLDDNLGMAFNGRRQSRDRCVRDKILSICKNSQLYMNEYSFGQFEEKTDNIVVDEDFLEKAGKGDFCFVENQSFSPMKAEMIYAFLWNRVYPSDIKLERSLEESGFTVIGSYDFKGYSHEKITLKTYKRRTENEEE